MKQKETYVRDTLVNVQRFLDANAEALGPVNSSGARKALDDAIASLTGHSVAQTEHTIGSTGETRKQRTLRLALRRQFLGPIARVAAANLGEVPDIVTFRLPSNNVRGSALVDVANGIANAAAAYAATFIAAGLKPDFLDGLRAMAHSLETSLGGRTDHRTKRRGSTIALASESSNGRKALRLLDAAIQQQLPDNPQLLAEWASIKRVPQKPGVVQSASATSVAPITTPPAAASPAQAIGSIQPKEVQAAA
jgi:hypothetical protein